MRFEANTQEVREIGADQHIFTEFGAERSNAACGIDGGADGGVPGQPVRVALP